MPSNSAIRRLASGNWWEATCAPRNPASRRWRVSSLPSSPCSLPDDPSLHSPLSSLRASMSDVVIQVDYLSKKYRLGMLGTGTLRHEFNRWLHRILGKPDPHPKEGQAQKSEVRSQADPASALWPLAAASPAPGTPAAWRKP